MYLPPWRVDVVRRAGQPAPLSDVALAKSVGAALEAGRAPRPGSVTVVLTDDEELADLNREHMGIDGPTDVLSFPMLPPEAFDEARAPAALVPPPGPEPRPAAPARRRVHVGDIAVSVERAIEQAQAGRGGQTGEVRWSPADELRLLVIHGALHLCGRDHANPDDEAAMRALERRLLRG